MRELLASMISGMEELGRSDHGGRLGVNLRDYGATGDGVADDTHAVQSAFDDAAASGGVLVVPPGKYRIAHTIAVRPRQRYLNVSKRPGANDPGGG